jgi:REP element-mobilizing transposase RayT
MQAKGPQGSRPHKRRHLRRLGEVFAAHQAPVFFVTVCARRRARVLATPEVAGILTEALSKVLFDHGWLVGRYVIMPDHVHFFCSPGSEQARSLSSFVGFWKRGTAAAIRKSGVREFAWQAEFFDHLLRHNESYAQKWDYVHHNPVRAGLVHNAEDWPHQGEVCQLTW